MNELFTKKNIRFAIAAFLYILVVIWIGNYWLLIGLAVIYDLYISEKVNWTFWKKRHGKNSAFVEWLDALDFCCYCCFAYKYFLLSELQNSDSFNGEITACW